MKATLLASALAGFTLIGQTTAGAGATVYACVYFATKPTTPIQMNFSVENAQTHCMNNQGNDVSMTITSAPVTCVSVGYVEQKSSSSGGDTCATDKSYWALSYTSPNTGYSGSMLSRWSGHDMSLSSASGKTQFCGSSAPCGQTEVTWSGTGTIYLRLYWVYSQLKNQKP
ncbi:uncharacterized protein BDZ83DRAFT_647674 [Colletotrichum acutatum]|uniref:AA1-like domain-containing protein n=1 Tax=Glomerella acutata TaxID=27357 RepID=A0AAD9D0R6_GLOAC|nr:uncharacterized protein BDZ83DRAFT_647674 [Colletotrichum acutatum]KAK1729744.1 hypothetical protein BDZ83DRAFT_647674 [Colletotrichum acutatum]